MDKPLSKEDRTWAERKVKALVRKALLMAAFEYTMMARGVGL